MGAVAPTARVRRADLVDVVSYVDPSAGKHGTDRIKKTRARSAIITVGQDLLGRIFVLQCWADRCSTDALINKMLEVNEQEKPRVFGGEADGLQSLFQDAIIREAKFKGIRLPLVPHRHPTTMDKLFRVRAALQKPLKEGRIFLRAEHVELEAEIRGFPHARLKDMIDAFASAVSMLPMRATVREETDQIDSLAAYLRETGASPDHIRTRVAEVRSQLGLGTSLPDARQGDVH